MSAIEHEITDSEYEDMLDEIYGEVEICGLTYSSGRALHELDPIAFRCGQSDSMLWECSECGKVYQDEEDAESCCPPDEDQEDDIDPIKEEDSIIAHLDKEEEN